jgi:RNA binding exosome subunit
MKIRRSGRTKESRAAIQKLCDFLEEFGEVKEVQESILVVDGRETVLVAFSSQAYYDQKGYYWFSLAKTKYTQMLEWNEDHAWMVLICGMHGQYFVPIGQIKSLLTKIPSNRRDGRWDLYIRFEGERAYFGVTKLRNHLDVTDQLQHFEQIWTKPTIEERYVDEAIYIPDSLPEPDRRMGKVLRVVRDTSQSRYIKELYSYRCQICGWTVYSPRLKSLWYCEAHHVKPLGRKYGGPDHRSNIIAVCPTHHCMMDLGVLAIDPSNLKVLSIDKQEAKKGQSLTLKGEHGLNKAYLQFHLDKIYVKNHEISEIQLSSVDQEF